MLLPAWQGCIATSIRDVVCGVRRIAVAWVKLQQQDDKLQQQADKLGLLCHIRNIH